MLTEIRPGFAAATVNPDTRNHTSKLVGNLLCVFENNKPSGFLV